MGSPAGFGGCETCPELRGAPAETCLECFRRDFASLDTSDVCLTCRHPLDGSSRCGNPLCGRTDRRFAWSRSLGALEEGDALHKMVIGYKYHKSPNLRGRVLGRMLAAFMLENSEVFTRFELIIPSPTYIGPDSAHSWDHTLFLVKEAARHLKGWPIMTDKVYIRKRCSTPSLARDARTWAERHAIATTFIRQSLLVPEMPDLHSAHVLVIDDLFTDGLTLDEIARALGDAGANRICGLSVARRIYRPRP